MAQNSQSETFRQINQLSEERLGLYRLAGKQHMTEAQRARIIEIKHQLEVLWDQHRREEVKAHRPAA